MLRTYEELKASFDRVVAVLDSALASARPLLDAQGIEVHDRSNRSCYDRSGYPVCRWTVRFDKQSVHGSEIALASADLEFMEPADDASERHLRADSIAEIYQIGKQSRVKDRLQQRIPVEELDRLDLYALVGRLIGEATLRLTGEGVVEDDAT
jgi:hypothetical protein